jgi:hypothetical protein
MAMQTKVCDIVKIRPGLALGLAGLMAVVALLFGTPAARASEGYVVYDAQNVEGLHVTVLARPNPISVGKIHLFIRLARPSGLSNEQPYRGANLLVEFYHLNGPGADKTTSYVQRRDLTAPESEPGTYELSDSIQNEGDYRVTLTIQNAPKPISTAFNIKALPEPDDRFLSLMLLSIFPIFLAWLIWMYLKRPGSRPDQPEPAGQADVAEPVAASPSEGKL